MHATKDDTNCFKSGIKMTTTHKFRDEEDLNDKWVTWTAVYLGSAVFWLALATILNLAADKWFILFYWSWACMGLAFLSVLIWAIIYLPKKPFKDAFKWVLNKLSKPFKWFINLPIA